MKVKRGLYRTQDGDFKPAWDGNGFIKEIREYDIVVLEVSGIEFMFLCQVKDETLISADGENVDRIEGENPDFFNMTRGTDTFLGSNMNDIEGRVTLGLINPVKEWVKPLTEITV